jgi:endonuclease YncB( thermonuclease family)
MMSAVKPKSRGFISLALACVCGSVSAADLSDIARVIDGATIEIRGTRVRLWGIDAPEREQTCVGANGDPYECGRDAAAVLSELTRDHQVACTPHSFYGYGIAAVCRTDSDELNAEMVRRGWAVDDTKYSGGRYLSDEVHARRERLGIWAGGFEILWKWRHRH